MNQYPWTTCPDQLSEDQILEFRQQGYLAFRDVLTREELEGARTALRDLTQRLAFGSTTEVSYRPGKCDGGNQSGGYYQFLDSTCFLQLEKKFDPIGKSIDEVDLQVRKYMNFTQEHASLQKVIEKGNRLHRMVESILGPDPILFQEMALVKPPHGGSEKPWHQDNAYFSVAPLESILGVWMALDDAMVENGCMHVIPGGHEIGALKHFHSTDCEIMPGRIDASRSVPVPIPAGGALFFYGLLPHQTPKNQSPHRRRALQFHYRAATSKIVDPETYNRVFAEADGTPASCAAATAVAS